ncbi:MAG: hypothetical protein R3F54_21365 [Alphaproteobacteria bacterium]
MAASRILDTSIPALAVAAGLLAASAFDRPALAYDLLTAEEYAERTPSGETRSLTVSANDGPDIIVHTPETSGALRSPLDFDVEFRAKDAEPVMGSLLVEYDLGLFWKDVTARIAEHAEITGNRIVSRGADLPAGDHHLRLSISDLAGKTTTTDLVLTVAD